MVYCKGVQDFVNRGLPALQEEGNPRRANDSSVSRVRVCHVKVDEGGMERFSEVNLERTSK